MADDPVVTKLKDPAPADSSVLDPNPLPQSTVDGIVRLNLDEKLDLAAEEKEGSDSTTPEPGKVETKVTPHPELLEAVKKIGDPKTLKNLSFGKLLQQFEGIVGVDLKKLCEEYDAVYSTEIAKEGYSIRNLIEGKTKDGSPSFANTILHIENEKGSKVAKFAHEMIIVSSNAYTNGQFDAALCKRKLAEYVQKNGLTQSDVEAASAAYKTLPSSFLAERRAVLDFIRDSTGASKSDAKAGPKVEITATPIDSKPADSKSSTRHRRNAQTKQHENSTFESEVTGLKLEERPATLTRLLDLNAFTLPGMKKTNGVYVSYGSTAHGVAPGTEIVSINGHRISSKSDVEKRIRNAKPYQTLFVTVKDPIFGSESQTILGTVPGTGGKKS